jgi:hypothetical protein
MRISLLSASHGTLWATPPEARPSNTIQPNFAAIFTLGTSKRIVVLLGKQWQMMRYRSVASEIQPLDSVTNPNNRLSQLEGILQHQLIRGQEKRNRSILLRIYIRRVSLISSTPSQEAASLASVAVEPSSGRGTPPAPLGGGSNDFRLQNSR